MTKSITFISVLLIIFSCDSDCYEDTRFKSEFNNAIDIVIAIQSEGMTSPFKYRVHSIEVLSAVTGHESLIYKDGDTPYFYMNTEDMKNDIRAWKKWYENNHCGFSIDNANALIKKYDKEELDFDLEWPPKLESIKGEKH